MYYDDTDNCIIHLGFTLIILTLIIGIVWCYSIGLY